MHFEGITGNGASQSCQILRFAQDERSLLSRKGREKAEKKKEAASEQPPVEID
jgi:hypothetical protein